MSFVKFIMHLVFFKVQLIVHCCLVNNLVPENESRLLDISLLSVVVGSFCSLLLVSDAVVSFYINTWKENQISFLFLYFVLVEYRTELMLMAELYLWVTHWAVVVLGFWSHYWG